jgi:hypothetical protein
VRLALVLVLSSGTAFAQEPPGDGKTAVELAGAAFEFRDFQKVVDVLRPWVRPMKILDDKLKIEARRMMGVSLHLLGRFDEAREEFGELLLLDPKHELDPFVVPPEVIGAFEAIRRELKPTLDKILLARGENPNPEPPLNLKVVTLPHPAMAILPFGVPQFLVNEPGWGAAFAIVQTLGLGTNIAGWIAGREVGRDGSSYDAWLAVQYTALAVTVLAYAGGVIHGIYLLNGIQERADVPPAP